MREPRQTTQEFPSLSSHPINAWTSKLRRSISPDTAELSAAPAPGAAWTSGYLWRRANITERDSHITSGNFHGPCLIESGSDCRRHRAGAQAFLPQLRPSVRQNGVRTRDAAASKESRRVAARRARRRSTTKFNSRRERDRNLTIRVHIACNGSKASIRALAPYSSSRILSDAIGVRTVNFSVRVENGARSQ
jgi:hypothetical protein